MTGSTAGGRELVNADKSPYNGHEGRPPPLAREVGALWAKRAVH